MNKLVLQELLSVVSLPVGALLAFIPIALTDFQTMVESPEATFKTLGATFLIIVLWNILIVRLDLDPLTDQYPPHWMKNSA